MKILRIVAKSLHQPNLRPVVRQAIYVRHQHAQNKSIFSSVFILSQPNWFRLFQPQFTRVALHKGQSVAVEQVTNIAISTRCRIGCATLCLITDGATFLEVLIFSPW
jgi:hypothetical protein